MSVLAVMLFSISSVFAQAGLNWENASVTVVGSGIAPPNAVNVAQARMLSRRAAVADAYRQLAELIKGVNVDAETTVENMMVKNDTVKTRVSACIQGATIVGEKEISGGYEVTMTVPLFGVTNSVALAVIPPNPTPVEFPEPEPKVTPAPPVTTVTTTVTTTTTTTTTTKTKTKTTTNPPAKPATTVKPATTTAKPSITTPKPSVTTPTKPPVTTPTKPSVTTPTKPITTPTKPATTTPKKPVTTPTKPAIKPVTSEAIGGFTGLIVDCRGLGLKPVMSPVIKNADGQSIYGHANLDYDKVIELGMAAYTTDISNIARAGSNPLVVKAVRLENHNGNPVISVADANRVLIENSKSGFLEKLNVVFIR